jgi:CDP-glucose 4,6-dehydratase
MGARVWGYSLAPPSEPNFYTLYGLARRLEAETTGDVADAGAVARAVEAARPQVLFHLAAQPIVREAHRDPVGTFATNVMGTVNVLQACRDSPLERAVLFTTDKVYRNDQSGRAMTEADRLGGNEPYSASKASAEWAIAAWWESYYRASRPPVSVCAVRAGNILGGGDWGRDRLVPDAVRAFAAGRELVVRNPGSTRPWQHVLDAVRGALLLAEMPPAADRRAEDLGWNFGPPDGDVQSVADVARLACDAWGDGARWLHEPDVSVRESRALVLSSARALAELGWRAAWGLERTVAESIAWYRQALASRDVAALTARQIERHCADAGRAAA